MSVITEERVDVKEGLKSPPKFNTFAINNDLTSFDEVVYILVHALNMNSSVAAELTMKVDREGRAKLNPRPLSRGLAQIQLDKLNETKVHLAQISPSRRVQIMALKFEIKEE